MRTTLRLVLPLIFSVAVVSLLFATYQVRTQRRELRNDLSRRAEILGDSLQESVEQILGRGSDKGLQLYDPAGAVIAITPALDPMFRTRPAVANRAAGQDGGVGEFVRGQPIH